MAATNVSSVVLKNMPQTMSRLAGSEFTALRRTSTEAMSRNQAMCHFAHPKSRVAIPRCFASRGEGPRSALRNQSSALAPIYPDDRFGTLSCHQVS
jgi:hypothetical protein